MDPADPLRARDLFYEALDLDTGTREAYIADRAGADTALRDATLKLLRAHAEAGSAMEPPHDAECVVHVLRDLLGLDEEPDQKNAARDLTGALIADIYRLAERLGTGTFGVVYAAKDEVTDRDVAVKFLHRWPDRLGDWLLREAGTLLLLDVPGVVHWHDHGIYEDTRYVVTDLVDGEPFPGCASPAAPTIVSAATAQLLTILARLHAAGVVHGDLKPANVLVDEQREITLVDLGSCVGESVAGLKDVTKTQVGTLSFLAPEQLGIERSPPTVATDLYAVGVLLFEALTATRPHAADTREEFVRKRSRDPIDFAALPADLPPRLRELVTSLLARAPEDRPQSAAAAYALLVDAPPSREAVRQLVAGLAAGLPTQPPVAEPPYSADTLRRLFLGHQRVFQIPGDAAALLHARTDGDPERVIAELTSWVQDRDARVETPAGAEADGLAPAQAHVVPDGFAIERVAIDRLEARFLNDAPSRALGPDRAAAASRRCAEFLKTGRHEDACGAALEGAYAWLDEGKPARGAALVRVVLGATRLLDATQVDREALLRALFEIALVQADPRSLGLVRYELERAEQSPLVRWLHTLTRAALLTVTGHGQVGLQLASALEPAADARLEARRQSIRVHAARTGAPELTESVLAAASAWAAAQDERSIHRQAADWRGSHAYQERRYAEAAAHFEEVVELADTPLTRLAALMKAASASVEVPDFEHAGELARAAIEIAYACRHPYFAVRAERLARVPLYRSCAATTWDRGLVAAARDVPVPMEVGLLLLNEAAVAWRGGDREAARDLAHESAETLTLAGATPPADLARALAFAADPQSCSAPSPEEAAAFLEQRSNTAALQTLALYAAGLSELDGSRLPPAVLVAARALADTIPPEGRAHRRDVLSIDKAIDLLDA